MKIALLRVKLFLVSGIGFDYAKTVAVEVLTTTSATAAVALEDAAGSSSACSRRAHWPDGWASWFQQEREARVADALMGTAHSPTAARKAAGRRACVGAPASSYLGQRDAGTSG